MITTPGEPKEDHKWGTKFAQWPTFG